MFEIPEWLIWGFLGLVAVDVLLGALGIYYIAFNKYSILSLTISTVIFVSLSVSYCIAMTLYKKSHPFQMIAELGLPISFLSVVFEEISGAAVIFTLIGFASNYLAIFSVVNFINRLVSNI